MKVYWRGKLELHDFLTSAPDGDQLQAFRRFASGEKRRPYFLKGVLGETESKCGCFKVNGCILPPPRIEPQFVGRPARRVVAMPLHYPA